MSIHRLASSTSRILQSSQIIPSFEAAVIAIARNALQSDARTIQITVSPEALRFTVADDGRGFAPADWPLALQPGCTSLREGRGQSLASLAAVAAVELHTRQGDFRARKFVRGGKLLEDVSTPADHVPGHDKLRDANGVVLDVWEMFHAVPVRRYAEAARHPARILDATRDMVVALSLANPHVALTLQGVNGVPFYEALERKPLSVDMIQAAFGVDHGLEWRPVKSRVVLLVDGFVARRGYTSSSICLVSLDGVPVPVKGWIHKAAQRAWKAYVARGASSDAGNHKFPAYVLNCRSSGKRSERTSARETVSRVTPPSPEAEQSIISAVHAALELEGLEAPSRSARLYRVDSEQLSALASARKRRPSSTEERFADTLVCKRSRMEISIWASRESRRALIRPLSEGSGVAFKARRSTQERKKTMRLCIERPSSAQEVESAYKKSLSGWSNPCFRGKAFVSRKASTACEEWEHSAHYMFMKRGITVARDKIPDLRIVGQVDRKFIVVVDGNSVVYAVDQHAASERYMYETLLKQTTASKIQSVTLSPPKKVALSHKQRAAVMYHSAALYHWGWRVRLTDGKNVEVFGAPSLKKLGVVLDGEAHLRSYLDSLGAGAVKQTIPRPMLEAVASAACHSAVRFGDSLSSEQCRSLVSSLAECDSPFICAHGRPSIVPLAVFDEV